MIATRIPAGCLLLASLLAPVLSTAAKNLILVVGAVGEAEYQAAFSAQTSAWQTSAYNGGWDVTTIGLGEDSTNDLARLRGTLETTKTNIAFTTWIVFIGHGSFDGKAARFNLRGPDLTSAELSEWLKPVASPLVIINTAASSAPFLNQLSSTNRVVVTATRSGHEQNYTRFGKYLAEAVQSLDADLDKDEQVSLLEAFLFASRRTAEFYKAEGRIATEHALIDDNGDGLGTPSEWFQGLRPTKKPKDSTTAVDGVFAHQQHLVPGESDRALSSEQIRRRDELERAVLDLRERKSQLPEVEYYLQIERLLLELARLYN